ncbi:hypothetical protein RHGRI_005056 [Rhododendron griersonianum]|uniref:Uncharacterized protein n=1 Tax=Rhododendron griersonianum TaxID=479676 RepID=A0AAV6LBU9_9ERIC|nr:hypothetical protein RHGRI_005056 [Rhododendron griersonianum]
MGPERQATSDRRDEPPIDRCAIKSGITFLNTSDCYSPDTNEVLLEIEYLRCSKGNQEAASFGGVLMDDKGAWISRVHPGTRRDSSRNGDGFAASSESDQRKSSSSSPS